MERRREEILSEMYGSRERDAYVCLNSYLFEEGGEWEGLSIIPNHLYSAAHITSPQLGVGESLFICIFGVTVEKLSVQAKYMAVLMYTFGVFVQSWGPRINVRVLFVGALTDANLSVVLGREGIFFFLRNLPCFFSFSGLSVPHKEFFIVAFQQFLAKKKNEFALHTL